MTACGLLLLQQRKGKFAIFNQEPGREVGLFVLAQSHQELHAIDDKLHCECGKNDAQQTTDDGATGYAQQHGNALCPAKRDVARNITRPARA